MENWIKSIESLQDVNRSPFLHRAVPLKIQVSSGKDKEGEHLAIWMGCKRKICRLNWETMAGVEWKWNGNAGYLPNWPQNPPRSFVFSWNRLCWRSLWGVQKLQWTHVQMNGQFPGTAEAVVTFWDKTAAVRCPASASLHYFSSPCSTPSSPPWVSQQK